VLLFDGFMFAQDKAPEPYHIKGDILGEPILTYRRNNPECAEKDSLDGLANFYHANNSAKLDNGVSSILLSEYSGDLDSSSLIFSMDDYLKQLRQRKQAKKASSDM